jgi:hypothetical protein
MELDGGGWTIFFAGLNGSTSVFAHFETGNDCSYAQTRCLRRLPAVVDSNAEFMATCGSAAVKFSMTPEGIRYFRDGIAAGWQPLSKVTQVSGANLALATWVWTGWPDTTNRGWIIADKDVPTGASTFSNSYDWHNAWDYCNGVEEGATPSAIRLMYR